MKDSTKRKIALITFILSSGLLTLYVFKILPNPMWRNIAVPLIFFSLALETMTPNEE